jgi:hypothetical protein
MFCVFKIEYDKVRLKLECNVVLAHAMKAYRESGDLALLIINPLTQELNPSAQRCLTRFLLGFFFLNRSCEIATQHVTRPITPHPQYSIDFSSIDHLSEGTRNAPGGWQCNAETCRRYHT